MFLCSCAISENFNDSAAPVMSVVSLWSRPGSYTANVQALPRERMIPSVSSEVIPPGTGRNQWVQGIYVDMEINLWHTLAFRGQSPHSTLAFPHVTPTT